MSRRGLGRLDAGALWGGVASGRKIHNHRGTSHLKNIMKNKVEGGGHCPVGESLLGSFQRVGRLPELQTFCNTGIDAFSGDAFARP